MSAIRFSAERMASTAAWSAAFSSPRPASRAAAIAAASVTRAISIVKILLSLAKTGLLEADASESLLPGDCSGSKPLDADHPRFSRRMTLVLDLFQRRPHGAFQRLMGDQDERRRLPLAALADAEARQRGTALDDALDRDVLARQHPGHRRHLARPVIKIERHVVAALMRPHRGTPAWHQRIRRHPEGRRLRAAGDIADVGDDARCRRMASGTLALEHQVARHV